VLYKRRGIGMFVSPGAADALRERRRKSFFTDVVDPMVAQAKTIGIPMSDLIERIGQLSNGEGA
jgi:DNA-binding transcriptional regulator YhcF (GntR family)